MVFGIHARAFARHARLRENVFKVTPLAIAEQKLKIASSPELRTALRNLPGLFDPRYCVWRIH